MRVARHSLAAPDPHQAGTGALGTDLDVGLLQAGHQTPPGKLAETDAQVVAQRPRHQQIGLRQRCLGPRRDATHVIGGAVRAIGGAVRVIGLVEPSQHAGQGILGDRHGVDILDQGAAERFVFGHPRAANRTECQVGRDDQGLRLRQVTGSVAQQKIVGRVKRGHQAVSLRALRSRPKAKRNLDFTVPKGSSVSSRDGDVRLVLEIGHSYQRGLLRRQRGDGLAQARAVFPGGKLVVGRRRCRRYHARVFGIERRPALAPQRIDPLVAGDGEHPGAHARLAGIERFRAPPNHQHGFLHQLFGLDAARAQAHQKSLESRREMREQRREGIAVAILRHRRHQTFEFQRSRPRHFSHRLPHDVMEGDSG